MQYYNIKEILSKYKIKINFKLDQYFLIDKKIIKKIVSYAELNRNDIVLEFGTGLGFITKEIAKKAGKVLSIEKDEKILEVTSKLLNEKNIQLIKGDFFKVNIPQFNKFISSPPYQFSRKIIEWISLRKIDSCVIVFQNDFAKKLIEEKGKNYTLVSVLPSISYKVELLDIVPCSSFYPPSPFPSRIVKLKFINEKYNEEEINNLIIFLKNIFSQKNKKLKHPLRNYLEKIIGIKDSNKINEIIHSIPLSEQKVCLIPKGEIIQIGTNIIKYLKS
ncbi:MAG: rRNA adenine N-6-methyltransferase family protein [Nitrososphaerota archaeon]